MNNKFVKHLPSFEKAFYGKHDSKKANWNLFADISTCDDTIKLMKKRMYFHYYINFHTKKCKNERLENASLIEKTFLFMQQNCIYSLLFGHSQLWALCRIY